MINYLKSGGMKLKNKLFIVLLIIVIISTCSIVSAGLFGDDSKDIKTHEFKYANAATFNISDELTNKTHVDNIIFGEGVSYKYKDGLVNMLGGISSGGASDAVESKDNDANYKKIDTNKTQQGFETHLYEWDGPTKEYQLYIDLNNATIVASDGFESQYDYFMGTFDSLEEANIFINTFKLIQNNTAEGT